MSDELPLRKATEKAAQAQAALDSPAVKEAFEKLEASYIAAWKNTDARDTDGRERAWTALTILTRVRENMARMISNGQIAQAELDRITAPPSDPR